MDLLTTAQFTVNDEGAGGPDYRVFVFETVFEDDGCTVTIRFSGSGPIQVCLNSGQPTEIPDCGARVRPTGTLTLKSNSANTTRFVLFSGILHTTHRASTLNVCIAVSG